MESDEVVHLARKFVRRAGDVGVPANLQRYAELANSKLRTEQLAPDEAGYTVPRADGSFVITTNAIDSDERQRFSICHEIAHIILDLPSRHSGVPLWAYAKRDTNEILCDQFAAELLMPYLSWIERASKLEPSLNTLQSLMSTFGVSYPAAGSRLADLAQFPCGFVTMSGGIVRYMKRSTDLRQSGAWVAPRSPIPTDSVAGELRASNSTDVREREVPQDLWFENWPAGDYLWEIGRHFDAFDTTTSLLWFDKEDLAPVERDRFGRSVDEGEGLSELTGELPWPGRSRRRS